MSNIPKSTKDQQPAGETGQLKDIATNIYNEYTKEHEQEPSQPNSKNVKKEYTDGLAEDDIVEHLSEKQAPKDHSTQGSRANLEERPKVEVNPAEIGKSLRDLHSKIDEVLRKTPGAKKDMYYSMAGTTVTDRERQGYGGSYYNNPFTGLEQNTRLYDATANLIQTPIRDRPLVQPQSTELPGYMKYSMSGVKNEGANIPSVSQQSLKYDKEKLDSIVNSILNRQGLSHRPSEKRGPGYDSQFLSPQFPGTAQDEGRSQIGKRYGAESLQQSHGFEEKKPSYCGELENDEDSIIIGYAQKAEEDYRKKFTYYCGGLEDDDN
jgi:hypothetical protein